MSSPLPKCGACGAPIDEPHASGCMYSNEGRVLGGAPLYDKVAGRVNQAQTDGAPFERNLSPDALAKLQEEYTMNDKFIEDFKRKIDVANHEIHHAIERLKHLEARRDTLKRDIVWGEARKQEVKSFFGEYRT